MPVTFPAALLMVALLSEATERPTLPRCDAPRLRVDLTPTHTVEAREVCVNPDFPTTFAFTPPLPPGAEIEVYPTNRFAESRGPQVLTFIPRADYLSGERVKVTVHFGDGAAPASVTFILVGHPARAVSQVQVFRHVRPVDVLQQEVREARAETRQCQEENARLRAERGRPDGLRGLFDAGLMNERGAPSLPLYQETSTLKGNALKIEGAISYRISGHGGLRGRVAVAVTLTNPGAHPWTVTGAALSGPNGEELTPLPLWHSGPIHSGPELVGHVVVEFQATKEQGQGTHTLKLWDAEGRTVTVGQVTFPPI
jgi:uncharacterized protein (TIGR02268 family)